MHIQANLYIIFPRAINLAITYILSFPFLHKCPKMHQKILGGGGGGGGEPKTQLPSPSLAQAHYTIILASRASFGHPYPKAPVMTPRLFVRNFLKCQSHVHNWIFFISMQLSWHCVRIFCFKYVDIFIHAHGWNLSILWYPLKIWTPQNFTILPILGTKFLNSG